MKFIFSIYGIGDEMADLEKFSAQSSAVIRVHEPVPHEEVWKVLAQAHIGVLPFPDETKFRVSSPIKLFEYMGAGLPVLVTRIVCHTDVIRDRNYAFWVETSDVDGFVEALRIVWKSRDSLQELGRHAAMAVQDWTWTASTKKMKAALEKGLNFPGGG
jgi:glycosyltransferase involved in cell wall biosynthesis